MTLQQLTYLVTVAECGNITDAAERLFLSQPSLSAAIHNLEKEMGVTAFVRSNKGVTVTQEGEELLSFARMLLEQADIMQEHFGVGKKRGPSSASVSALFVRGERIRRGCQGVQRGPVRFYPAGNTDR
ncbi:MAG: LysR family transcriptional regulator [Butyricicoccus sp.]